MSLSGLLDGCVSIFLDSASGTGHTTDTGRWSPTYREGHMSNATAIDTSWLDELYDHDWCITRVGEWLHIDDTATGWLARVEDVDNVRDAVLASPRKATEDNPWDSYQVLCDALPAVDESEVPAAVIKALREELWLDDEAPLTWGY